MKEVGEAVMEEVGEAIMKEVGEAIMKEVGEAIMKEVGEVVMKGVGDGQGALVCCSPWGCKELDTTERLNWMKKHWFVNIQIFTLTLYFIWPEIYLNKVLTFQKYWVIIWAIFWDTLKL